jgi:hypothetical protein
VPFDVVNGGVSGYGQAQEYLWLQAEGYKYSPDVVVVVVFLGNDLIDNLRDRNGRWERPRFAVAGDGQLAQVSWPTRDPYRRAGWDEFLLRHARVYNFWQSGVVDKLDQPADKAGETGDEPDQDFQIYRLDQTQKLRQAWDVTEQLLAAISRQSEAMGAQTVVVGAPSVRALDRNRFAQLVSERGLDSIDYDPDLPSRLLNEAMARQHLAHLDLLPVFRSAAADGAEDIFYPRNTHWAPAGQSLVARAIDAFLEGNGFLPD